MAALVRRGGVCVLFALRREADPLLRAFPRRERIRPAPCPAWRCPGGLRVLVTGVGTERAGAALDWLLARSPGPGLVVAAGFAGALQAGLTVGDIVHAAEVVDGAGRVWHTSGPAAVGARVGRLYTSPHLISAPAEKRRLGRDHAALAVDMESAAVGTGCCARGVPFGCVRVISDGVETALSPRLVGLLDGGRVAPGRLLMELARSPRLAGELLRLARDTRRAARKLGRHLYGLLNSADRPNPPVCLSI